MKLGIDFGNVISYDKTLSISQDPEYLDRHLVPGVIESVAAVVPQFEAVYIVSKCSEPSESRIRAFLDSIEFWCRTSIPRENCRFVRERADKAGVCKELGITHFVDDRIEVLTPMDSVLLKIALDPRDKNRLDPLLFEGYDPRASNILIVPDWWDARTLIELSLEAVHGRQSTSESGTVGA